MGEKKSNQQSLAVKKKEKGKMRKNIINQFQG